MAPSSGGRGRRSVRTGARVLKAAAIIVRGVRLVAIAPGGLPVAATATGDPRVAAIAVGGLPVDGHADGALLLHVGACGGDIAVVRLSPACGV